MKGCKRTRRTLLGLFTGVVFWSVLMMGGWAQAADLSAHKPWSVGATMGFLANTPDDTAFALNLNADANLNRQVSIGPLLQLGFTDDLAMVGLSGQGKYFLPLSNLGERFRLNLQGGVGFVHADTGPSDTSFLIPLGFGVDYQIDSQLAFKSDFLLNITDLDFGRGRGNDDTNIMPSLTFGVGF